MRKSKRGWEWFSYLNVANAVLEAVLPHQSLLVPDEVLHLLDLHAEHLHQIKWSKICNLLVTIDRISMFYRKCA